MIIDNISTNNSTVQFGPYFIFVIILFVCIYVLIGLYLTNGITDTTMLCLAWLVHTCLSATFVNMICITYYWSVIRKKTGLPGIRGIPGDRGKKGITGSCGIDSAGAYAIREIAINLNNLYKNKYGIDIIDLKTYIFINLYLNDKISQMINSKQFNTLIYASTTNRVPIIKLVNYLNEKITVWFNLIDAASEGKWFNDIYGDESSDWVSGRENPFIEIRKYDIYNWGLSDSFRPLKISVCKSNPLYKNGNLPVKSTSARLKIIESNDYDGIATDSSADGNPDISWWRAKKVVLGTDVYYPVGDLPMAGDRQQTYYGAFKSGKTIVGTMEYDVQNGGAVGLNTINGPDTQTILVSGDVRPPISYKKIWSYDGDLNPGLWRPECSNGYVAIGDIASFSGNVTVKNNNVMCIPEECAQPIISSGNTIWSADKLSTRVLNGWNAGNNDNSAKPEYGYNLMRTDDDGVFYKIRDKCLAHDSDASSTKELEPETSKLGIGWYGSPFKDEPKYSIFTFLNLIPEGMIINIESTRKNYIIHYGGEDANRFLVLEHNTKTTKYDAALEVDSIMTSNKLQITDVSKDNPKQQWIISFINSSKTIFSLKNVYNNKYLIITVNASVASSTDMYSTSETVPTSGQFKFESAVGTSLSSIENNTHSPTQKA